MTQTELPLKEKEKTVEDYAAELENAIAYYNAVKNEWDETLQCAAQRLGQAAFSLRWALIELEEK